MKLLRLGLKYCGGCSPRFDRVAWVEEFTRRSVGQIELFPYDTPEIVGVLVVTGCESACVDIAPFASKPVFMVSEKTQLLEMVQSIVKEQIRCM